MNAHTPLPSCSWFKNQSIMPLQYMGQMASWLGSCLVMCKIFFFSSNGIVCIPREGLLYGHFLLSFVPGRVLYNEVGCFTWTTFIPFNVSHMSLLRITVCYLMDKLLVELLTLASFSCSWTHQAYFISGHLYMLFPVLKSLPTGFYRAKYFASFGFFASIGSNILLS